MSIHVSVYSTLVHDNKTVCDPREKMHNPVQLFSGLLAVISMYRYVHVHVKTLRDYHIYFRAVYIYMYDRLAR